jgi:P-type Mg2+ transporter
MKQPSHAFWSVTAAEILKKLQTTPQGLGEGEAQERLARHGSNLLKPKKKTDALTLLLSQFKSPIILILLFAVGLSFLLHDSADALFILIIVLVSGLLGFWQERGVINAVEKLLAIVQIKATVIRDGASKKVPVEKIVPGDLVVLNAGDLRGPLISHRKG